MQLLQVATGESLVSDQSLEVTSSWESAMILCHCGDVFRASGSPDDVRQKQQAWCDQHRDCIPRQREGSKVFWLSFCDAERPKGQQFLGACVVEVTAAEADDAALVVAVQFPFAEPDAEWIAAAMSKAHRLGCNPGGEVATVELPNDHPNLSRYTFGVLMDRPTIEALDRAMASATKVGAVDPSATDTGKRTTRDPKS